MMKLVRVVRTRMTQVLNVALMAAVALLVVDVCWGVFTRYALGEQANWTEELARFLLVWVALLGGAVAFGTKGHLGVDYVVGKLHPAGAKVVAVVAQLVVLLFAGAIFLYGGFHLVGDSLQMEQMTPALGWKMGYVYLAVPISGMFMLLFTIENIIEIARTPSGQLQEPAPPKEVA